MSLPRCLAFEAGIAVLKRECRSQRPELKRYTDIETEPKIFCVQLGFMQTYLRRTRHVGTIRLYPSQRASLDQRRV
jgi:hypothetical protein